MAKRGDVVMVPFSTLKRARARNAKKQSGNVKMVSFAELKRARARNAKKQSGVAMVSFDELQSARAKIAKEDRMGPDCFIAGTGKGKYWFCKSKKGECKTGKKSKSKYWPKRNRCALTRSEYSSR
mgnify:CR=1 FL=1